MTSRESPRCKRLDVIAPRKHAKLGPEPEKRPGKANPGNSPRPRNAPQRRNGTAPEDARQRTGKAGGARSGRRAPRRTRRMRTRRWNRPSGEVPDGAVDAARRRDTADVCRPSPEAVRATHGVPGRRQTGGAGGGGGAAGAKRRKKKRKRRWCGRLRRPRGPRGPSREAAGRARVRERKALARRPGAGEGKAAGKPVVTGCGNGDSLGRPLPRRGLPSGVAGRAPAPRCVRRVG